MSFRWSICEEQQRRGTSGFDRGLYIIMYIDILHIVEALFFEIKGR